MESKQQVNWQDYMQMFLRRKWFFIVPFISVFVLSVLATFIMPKTYQAQAIILVEEEGMVNPLLSNLAVSTSVGDRLHKIREEILSWPRLLQLIEELELNKDVRSSLELENLIRGIRGKISLRMRGRDIIVISYQDKIPSITQKVVNTLCDILIRRNIIAQNAEADSAITFIEDQLKFYQDRLEVSEDALRKFKETYGLQMPLASQINAELAQLEAELTTALVDCTDDHPRVKELKRRIGGLREKRLQQIQEMAKTADVDDYNNYVDIADSIPKQEQELARLTRDRQVNEELYAMLLERLETARISQQLESSENKTKFKIVEPARLPLKPVKPNPLQINILGLVLGVALGFGCVYLLEYTDRSFKKAEDLKDAFNLPILGSIPKIVTDDDIAQTKIRNKRILIWSVIGVLLVLILATVIMKIIF